MRASPGSEDAAWPDRLVQQGVEDGDQERRQRGQSRRDQEHGRDGAGSAPLRHRAAVQPLGDPVERVRGAGQRLGDVLAEVVAVVGDGVAGGAVVGVDGVNPGDGDELVVDRVVDEQGSGGFGTAQVELGQRGLDGGQGQDRGQRLGQVVAEVEEGIAGEVGGLAL